MAKEVRELALRGDIVIHHRMRHRGTILSIIPLLGSRNRSRRGTTKALKRKSYSSRDDCLGNSRLIQAPPYPLRRGQLGIGSYVLVISGTWPLCNIKC